MSTGRRGADAERRARKVLEAAGFEVVRSAASKGVVDLVAWNGQTLRLVQVKYRCYAVERRARGAAALAAAAWRDRGDLAVRGTPARAGNRSLVTEVVMDLERIGQLAVRWRRLERQYLAQEEDVRVGRLGPGKQREDKREMEAARETLAGAIDAFEGV